MQIALPFTYTPKFEELDFVAAPSNAIARAWVLEPEAFTRWPDGRMVLWGESGTGKTHLLSIWAKRHGVSVIQGNELQESDVATIFNVDFDGGTHLEEMRAVVLDNADCVTKEQNLLHLINLAREYQVPLLMAARQPPARWSVGLPDLQSRLRATSSVAIDPAEEYLLYRLLLRLLAERQLVVAHQVILWLLCRIPRRASAVCACVALLDQMVMAEGGVVTRALAARALEHLGVSYEV
ncbi:MAG: chromosomal replication initiator DnaA [Acetobacter sp.]|nr:chromosomal replication initiator DnaA [Acetobacter sp.]